MFDLNRNADRMPQRFHSVSASKTIVNNNCCCYDGVTLRIEAMPETIEPPSLLETAHTLYRERAETVSYPAIAQHMGFSREWVRRFVSGDIRNPGVLTVEAFIKAVRELSE